MILIDILPYFKAILMDLLKFSAIWTAQLFPAVSIRYTIDKSTNVMCAKTYCV